MKIKRFPKLVKGIIKEINGQINEYTIIVINIFRSSYKDIKTGAPGWLGPLSI